MCFFLVLSVCVCVFLFGFVCVCVSFWFCLCVCFFLVLSVCVFLFGMVCVQMIAVAFLLSMSIGLGVSYRLLGERILRRSIMDMIRHIEQGARLKQETGQQVRNFWYFRKNLERKSLPALAD